MFGLLTRLRSYFDNALLADGPCPPSTQSLLGFHGQSMLRLERF